MASNVTVIPPKAVQPDILRVAAYCRVSSDSTDQLHSYAAQIKEYTEQINGHAGWELVDVYADEGLTGTRMDKREDFNRMLADCRKGRIDKVLVKSISRFARNTRDCLASLRELSRLGVSVYFEKENIDTGTLTTELMVSVSGSLAQQESISISQNQQMSYQKRMERGEFITCSAPFGYRLVDGKDLEIVSEEAEQVRWMFQSYLNGRSLEWIAAEMTKKEFPTTDKTPYWQHSTVLYVLAALLQAVDDLRRAGIMPADALRLIEFIGVKVHEERLVCSGLFPIDGGEFIPECRLVRAAAIVADHGFGAGPDGFNKLLRLIAVRRELGRKELEVAARKSVLVHREQRSIQIKQYGRDHYACLLRARIHDVSYRFLFAKTRRNHHVYLS